MTVLITACPKCKTLVLDDTTMCPSCHHVLKEGFEHLAALYVATDDKYDGSKDVSCLECDAKNRDGLVRCWQCGAFLREEIKNAYQEMKSHPVPAELVDPNLQQDGTTETADQIEDAGDDFELSEDVSMFQADEGWFPDSEQQAPEVDQDSDDEDEEEDLFDLAVTEEKETGSKAGKKASRQKSFLVKGPCGSCKIRVQNYHQGKIGSCPKCSLPFMVPVITPPKTKTKKKENAEAASLPENLLLTSAKWHEIIEKKFKPKKNMLKGKGENVDIIRHEEGLLFAWSEKKGLAGVSAAQTEKTRGEIAGHILASKPLDKLPASRSELIPIELLQQIRFAWPSTEENTVEDSSQEKDSAQQDTTEENAEGHFLAGVPAFGETAIVLEIPMLPLAPESDSETEPAHPGIKQTKKKPKKVKRRRREKPPEEPPTRCLSLSLTQYRKLRSWLEEMTGQSDFLVQETIPLEDLTQQLKCELSEAEFDVLVWPELYQDDPTIETTVVGWACQCNDVFITEQAREEQKFGGKKPAGLAKAKCPQCEQKFGQNPLYHLTSVVAPPTEPEQEPSTKETPEEPKASKDSAKQTTKKKPKKKSSFAGMFGKKKKTADSDSTES
ncbi:MAG: hypothetical protein JKY95_11725 [Planctomycetaceae bacterium]|nr:hypothetical protein [Planctomycetaceae bacterium]